MSWEEKIETDWNKKEISFVEKHKESNKIIDFTTEIKRNETMRFSIINSLKIETPKINESVFILTSKAISLLDVMNYIEEKEGQINQAILYFYTINEKAVKYTIDLQKRIKSLKIIISDLMNSKREKERIITRLFDENNIDIVFCHNHAKIASFQIGENYYTITGSMNAGNNARIESLQIFNDKKMFTFVEENFNLFKNEFSIKKRYALRH